MPPIVPKVPPNWMLMSPMEQQEWLRTHSNGTPAPKGAPGASSPIVPPPTGVTPPHRKKITFYGPSKPPTPPAPKRPPLTKYQPVRITPVPPAPKASLKTASKSSSAASAVTDYSKTTTGKKFPKGVLQAVSAANKKAMDSAKKIEEKRDQLLDSTKKLYDGWLAKGVLRGEWMDKPRKHLQESFDRAARHTAEATRRLLDSKIDPDKYWNEMPATKKIMALIGEGLYDAGNIAFGKPTAVNQVSKLLNAAINRDVAAQKEEYRQLIYNQTSSNRNQTAMLNAISKLDQSKAQLAKDMVTLQLGRLGLDARSLEASTKAAAVIAKIQSGTIKMAIAGAPVVSTHSSKKTKESSGKSSGMTAGIATGTKKAPLTADELKRQNANKKAEWEFKARLPARDRKELDSMDSQIRKMNALEKRFAKFGTLDKVAGAIGNKIGIGSKVGQVMADIFAMKIAWWQELNKGRLSDRDVDFAQKLQSGNPIAVTPAQMHRYLGIARKFLRLHRKDVLDKARALGLHVPDSLYLK